MKTNYVLAFLFLAFISIAVIANINEGDLIGCTELNGSGCVCHSVEKDTLVQVWIEGPESLNVGQTGYFKMFMAGGPAEAGGYNVAGRFGRMVLVDTFSFQHELALNELTQAFSLPFSTPEDTIYWEFGYTPSDSSSEWDTIYSCGLSLVWDSIPDFLDRWNFGTKFPIKVLGLATDFDERDNLIKEFQLYQNYPNPFNPSTKIRYEIPLLGGDEKGGYVTLKVYDVLGNEVATLIKEEKFAGSYEVSFDAAELTSGIYFYQLKAGNYSETKKMVLTK